MDAPSTATALSLALGLMTSAVDDQLASPLVYQAWAPQLRLGVDRRAERWFEATLSGGPRWSTPIQHGRRHIALESTDPWTGEIDTLDIVLPTGGLEIEAESALLGRVGSVWLGGGLRLEGRYTASGHALGSWADSELGLEVRVADVHHGTRWTLQGGAALHVLGLVTRFPYGMNPIKHDRSLVAGFFERGTRVTTPRGHQALRLDGRLQSKGRRALQPFLEGQLSLVADRAPEPLLRSRAILSVGLGGVPGEVAP